MKKRMPVYRGGQRILRHLGTISLVLFLTLLLGSFLLVLSLVHQSKQARANTPGHASALTHAGSASASPSGVYIGSGDGTLNKLSGQTGSLLWRYKTMGVSIPAAATVVAGVVYLGSQEGNVYALNASSGGVLWQFHTNAAVIASPAVVNSVVYIGSSDGNVYALNASTGAALWHYRAGPATIAVAVNTVVVSNGVVYGSSSDEVSQSYLFALDATSGVQHWRIQVQNQLFTAPQVAKGTLYLASSALKQQGGPDITDSYVYAYNTSDGTLLWRSDRVGDSILSTPTVVNGVVYSGSRDTFLYAFNAVTGKRLWRTQVGGEIHSSPQVDNGVVYAGVMVTATATAVGSTTDTSAGGGELIAMNANTGAVLWRHAVTNYQGTPLAALQGVLYVGASDGSVYALQASNGTTIWSYQGPGGVVLPFDNAPITVAP